MIRLADLKGFLDEHQPYQRRRLTKPEIRDAYAQALSRHGLVSVAEASSRLGVSRQRIHQLISAGHLKATQVGGWRMAIREDDLRRFLKSRLRGQKKPDVNPRAAHW